MHLFRDSLDTMFVHIGGRQHAGRKHHPVFGDVSVMLLALHEDAERIRTNPRNPLAKCYAELEHEHAHV